MTENSEKIVVNVNITVNSRVLITMVQQAKEIVGMDAKGRYQVDTADLLARLTSQFLDEYDFEAYVANRRHYPPL
jgi:hypothetical protein